MTNQISHDDPIWDLTPTELLIAYLSLTKTKPEIAAAALISEGTVGTHLTNIFKKLGLSEYEDDVKRSLMDTRHGEALILVVGEIDNKYDHRDEKIKALRKKTSEAKEIEERVQTVPAQPTIQPPSPAQPTMERPPPAPRQIPSPQVEPRRDDDGGVLGVIVALVSIVGLVLILNFGRRADNNNVNDVNSSPLPSQNPFPTPIETFTPVSPTVAFTPAIPPTAVPLPIREDFSQQYSDLWKVVGDPIISERVAGGRYSGGVLTTRIGESASLLIGNTAWTDYVVTVRVNLGTSGYPVPTLLIGVRVKDLNNMVALDCGQQYCTWVIFYNGQVDRLENTRSGMITEDGLQFIVDGDSINVVGKRGTLEPRRMSLVLPPKYKDKFPGGGVLIQISSNIEIDYIQIDPLP